MAGTSGVLRHSYPDRAQEAQSAWREERERDERAGSDADRGNGPHALNRSFSGTY